MLNDVITLPVDTLNNGVTTDLDYIRFDEYQNRTVYISENHTPAMRDLLTFNRTFPKQIGTFFGTRKTAAKFTCDNVVATNDGGTVISPAIVEISSSLPIGLTDAQLTEVRQRVIALIDQDLLMNKFQGLQII